MKSQFTALGRTVVFDPPPAAIAPSEDFIARLLQQSLLLSEDWDALPKGEKRRVLESPDNRSAMEQLVKHGLLTAYQCRRIDAGTTFGLVLGSYRVLDRVGAGGMAVVFKAEHMDLRHHVAIKVLPPTTREDSLLEARFFAEMRIIARLRHPNIVAATDAGRTISDDGNTTLRYVVMEYIPGLDLEEAVRQRGPMIPIRACSIAYQMASALGETHKFGLVHRDIKPSNVMLTGEDQAKLMDFGLTRHFGERKTAPGTILGTIDFMAPEQARDASTVDIRADIFGLGATLFWCLTGKLPFPSQGSPVEALTRRLTAPSPSIRQVIPALPAGLDSVVSRMMAPRPEDRYSEPAAVMQALLPFITSAARGPDVPLEPEFAESVEVVTLPDDDAPTEKARILLVDDEASVRKLCRQILKSEGDAIDEAANGTQALAMAAKTHYDLVLLDVAMPDMTGVEVLDQLRQRQPTTFQKVLMYSGHATPEEMSDLLSRGADDFLTKPFSVAQLIARVENLLCLKAAQDKSASLNLHLAAVNAQLQDEVSRRGGDGHGVRNALVLAAATAAEMREGRGAGHPIRMQRYCRALAEVAALAPAFAGQIDCQFVELIEYCAAIHDLGRAALPDHILLKTSPPTPEERHTLETHTVIASELFRNLSRAAAGGQAFLQMAVAVTRHHHERFDGTGYPDRLAGAAIPLAARLVAVADAYDALRCRRPNKPGLPHAAVVQALTSNSPGQFDPGVLEVFLQVAEKFEASFRENPD